MKALIPAGALVGVDGVVIDGVAYGRARLLHGFVVWERAVPDYALVAIRSDVPIEVELPDAQSWAMEQS